MEYLPMALLVFSMPIGYQIGKYFFGEPPYKEIGGAGLCGMVGLWVGTIMALLI